MSLDFSRASWHYGFLGAAVVAVACQTPGEDFQGFAADATTNTGAPTDTTSTVSTNTATVNTASSSGGSGSTSTDGTSTTQGGSTSSDTSTVTTDGSTNSTTTDAGTTDGMGGSTSTDTSTATTGSVSEGNVVDNFDFETSSDPCEVDESDWATEGDLNWSGGDDEICGYCIVLDPNQSGQLNWAGNAGTPPTLEAGTYRFSVDVVSNDGTPPSLRAKVGQPVEPYEAFLEEDVSVTSSVSTFSGMFTLDGSDQVGIAFFVSVGDGWGKICFDNVVIEPQ